MRVGYDYADAQVFGFLGANWFSEMRAVQEYFPELPRREVNFQIQVLSSAFYRNKAAYVIGKVVNGASEYPFAVPVLPPTTKRWRRS